MRDALTMPRFTEELLTRPPTSGLDVVTTLKHFAIVTYAVEPDRIRPHLHPRFEVECFKDRSGRLKGWVSIVPFEDQDFRLASLFWPKFRFGQTNYRTYVIDRETGRRAVWFFGTTLDSLTVNVPRRLWKLPWHRGRMTIDCAFNVVSQKYERYRISTTSKWAPLDLELEDTGETLHALEGTEDLEAGLVILTHPLLGVFYRTDGALGSYRIWHDRLATTIGKCVHARIGLFDRLGIVPFARQSQPHSVLLQHRTEFTIYLPPRRFV